MAPYTKTYTFSNGTTADGGQVDAEITALGTSVNNITNAQIDAAANIAISKTALGTFTDWTSWTPDYIGFSVKPTTAYAKYMVIGKLLILAYRVGTAGTSNSVSFQITGLPIAPDASGPGSMDFICPVGQNNGVNTQVQVLLTAGSTTIDLGPGIAPSTISAWTASGTKYAQAFTIMYKIA